MAERRRAWREGVMPRLDPRRLVFVDEAWAKTDMARAHGYAPRGERRVDAAPHRHRHTTTFVGAITTRGFVAPTALDGAVDGEWFPAYVGRALVPEPRRGDGAVLDNLGSHTAAGARRAVEGAGCRLLFLPPHSPDLNPIENAFAKPKGLLRSAAERTVGRLWSAIGRLLDRFRPAECRNYFRHCGHRRHATRS